MLEVEMFSFLQAYREILDPLEGLKMVAPEGILLSGSHLIYDPFWCMSLGWGGGGILTLYIL